MEFEKLDGVFVYKNSNNYKDVTARGIPVMS